MWGRTQLHVSKKPKITDKCQDLPYCHSPQREQETEDKKKPKNGLGRGVGGGKGT